MSTADISKADISKLTDAKVFVQVEDKFRQEISITEIILTESLLTPGLQTVVTGENKIDMPYLKDLDTYYNKPIIIDLKRPILEKYDRIPNLSINQLVYRLSNRKRINYNIETYQLDACDPSLIIDAKKYVTFNTPCQTPSQTVQQILSNCIQAAKVNIEASQPPRKYTADNIHPFQAINQLADVALTGSNDPSFIHYMTYEDGGTHHFRSLTSLASQSPVATYFYSGKGVKEQNYDNPFDIMDYEFPCDFDLLSDVLNGYDEQGNDITAVALINLQTAKFGLSGTPFGDCGTTPYVASTTTETESEQESCNPRIEQYLVKRKPRLALLDQDKIAIRITLPFSPYLHVGNVIRIIIPNREQEGKQNYGSGFYMISNMTHSIKFGGLGTTVLECVSNTVAAGKV